MPHAAGLASLHDTDAVFVRLAEVSRVGMKLHRQLCRQDIADRSSPPLVVFIAQEDDEARAPFVIGRSLRIETEHIGAVADQSRRVAQCRKSRGEDRRYRLAVE